MQIIGIRTGLVLGVDVPSMEALCFRESAAAGRRGVRLVGFDPPAPEPPPAKPRAPRGVTSIVPAAAGDGDRHFECMGAGCWCPPSRRV